LEAFGTTFFVILRRRNPRVSRVILENTSGFVLRPGHEVYSRDCQRKRDEKIKQNSLTLLFRWVLRWGNLLSRLLIYMIGFRKVCHDWRHFASIYYTASSCSAALPNAATELISWGKVVFHHDTNIFQAELLGVNSRREPSL